MGLVDSHCHLNFKPLGEDMEGVLARAREAGVSHMLNVSVNLEDYPQVLALAREHDNIYASVGVHPCYQDARDPTVEELLELADDPRVIAIGETGLDYFRIGGDMQWQKDRFARHIRAAVKIDKPLIIHTREAAEDTINILREEQAQRCGAVMHCFAENWEVASQALELGFYISFSGIVTFNSAAQLKEVARKTPLDRILVETDAPYLAPVPMRGKPNQPAFVAHTARYVAELKGLDIERLQEQTTENFFSLFRSAQR